MMTYQDAAESIVSKLDKELSVYTTFADNKDINNDLFAVVFRKDEDFPNIYNATVRHCNRDGHINKIIGKLYHIRGLEGMITVCRELDEHTAVLENNDGPILLSEALYEAQAEEKRINDYNKKLGEKSNDR